MLLEAGRRPLRDSKVGIRRPAAHAAAERVRRVGFSVCAHKYGDGCIAYFGDTNCSEHNPRVVSAFCRANYDTYMRTMNRRELGIGLAEKLANQAKASAAADGAHEDILACRALAVAIVAVVIGGVTAYYWY